MRKLHFIPLKTYFTRYNGFKHAVVNVQTLILMYLGLTVKINAYALFTC